MRISDWSSDVCSSDLLLTLSYALLGRVDEAAAARAELLAAYPSMSAELLLNQDWAFARTEEERLLLDGFRAAGIDLCASEADLAGVTNARHLPDCELGRASGRERECKIG